MVSIFQMKYWFPTFLQIFIFICSLMLVRCIEIWNEDGPLKIKMIFTVFYFCLAVILSHAFSETITFCCKLGHCILMHPQSPFANYTESIANYLGITEL
ncbi:hypothetical protein TNIN_492491 [Trichonephila inaurata madagascariensis]|uniref:Uncharacterized protein n=1 Tax=Trichonephila inaurata madagascariensis TaxID=2747483 RepID=A0A8X6XXT2_9ARAC|nr:hypothetical protein TNIN_492491 [Trichonephila inaurata madagascariensis]